jgi:hypothetical protein
MADQPGVTPIRGHKGVCRGINRENGWMTWGCREMTAKKLANNDLLINESLNELWGMAKTAAVVHEQIGDMPFRAQ